jgi:hypothetical protein
LVLYGSIQIWIIGQALILAFLAKGLVRHPRLRWRLSWRRQAQDVPELDF